MLVARELDIAPDPLELARRVSSRPGAVVFWSQTGGESFIASDPVERQHGLDPEPELLLRPAESELETVPRWVGVLPYEARRSLERSFDPALEDRAAPHVSEATWWRYAAVARVTDRVMVVGDSADDVDALAQRLRQPAAPSGAGLSLLGSVEAPEIHVGRIERALELIGAGEIYQVNLARRFRFDVRGDAASLLAHLAAAAPTPYGFALAIDDLKVASTSPELFLELAGDRSLCTIPIKGTRPRGSDEVSDSANAAELDADPKERAELAMILDVERNDLGRVAEIGTVRLAQPPSVRTWRTIHHRSASLGARLKRGMSRTHLLEAMLPSGSVTGAPKIRAMEVIRELEPHRRGLYTGALGMLRQNGALTLSMAIRTLTVRGDEGHYFAGGGIVADSSPWREVDETAWKAIQVGDLRRAGALQVPDAARKLGLQLS